jgi:hypothetical protein
MFSSGMRNPDLTMRQRKRAAHRRDRNRALWAGAALTLIFAGSLYMATYVIKPSDSLRSANRAGQSTMASKPASGSGAGDQNGDDYLSTGSILFVPHQGNICRKRLIDNKTWRMHDKGYVTCDEAVSWNANNANTVGTTYTATSRVDAIRGGFFRK